MKKPANVSWFPWGYFTVTFGFSWLCWLPDVLDTSGIIKLPVTPKLFLALGVMGPIVGAIWVIVGKGGWGAVRNLFARALDLRFRLGWWLVILIAPFIASTLAYIAFGLLKGQEVDLTVFRTPWVVIPSILLMLFLGGGQEEFGWRGVALDVLQERWNSVKASLILGLIHGIWHLPLFFIQGTGQYYIPLWAFLLTTPAMSILTTWIYNSTGRRLFAAWLFHATLNAGMGLFPLVQMVPNADQSGFLIICGLFWIWALAVIAIFGSQRLARKEMVEAASAAPVAGSLEN